MTPENNPDILFSRDIADRMDIDVRSVYKMGWVTKVRIRNGQPLLSKHLPRPAGRKGNKPFWRRADIDKMIEARRPYRRRVSEEA